MHRDNIRRGQRSRSERAVRKPQPQRSKCTGAFARRLQGIGEPLHATRFTISASQRDDRQMRRGLVIPKIC